MKHLDEVHHEMMKSEEVIENMQQIIDKQNKLIDEIFLVTTNTYLDDSKRYFIDLLGEIEDLIHRYKGRK